MYLGKIISSEKDRYLVLLNSYESFDSSDHRIYCKGRGVFRDKNIIPTVGDKVSITIEGDEGTIIEVHERENMLLRPPVANVDQVLVVQTICEPEINALAFDKLMAVLEKRNLSIVLCFNKIDRVDELLLAEWQKRYENIGYIVHTISALTGDGVNGVKEALKNKITAIAGPSGAGKSTLIKKLTGNETVEVGEISKKTSRGKQTTRRIELFEIEKDSFIFDTPGFSILDLRDFEEASEISEGFPEILRESNYCKFRNCTHRKEPGCAVVKAVKKGIIDKKRYLNYVTMFQEIELRKKY